MFSLKDVPKTKFIVTNIQGIQASTSLPKISSAIQVSQQNTDVSELIRGTEICLEALTSDSTLTQQNVDLGLIYSVGYRINYTDNRSKVSATTFLNDSGGKVTTGYVGNQSIKSLTPKLIL